MGHFLGYHSLFFVILQHNKIFVVVHVACYHDAVWMNWAAWWMNRLCSLVVWQQILQNILWLEWEYALWIVPVMFMVELINFCRALNLKHTQWWAMMNHASLWCFQSRCFLFVISFAVMLKPCYTEFDCFHNQMKELNVVEMCFHWRKNLFFVIFSQSSAHLCFTDHFLHNCGESLWQISPDKL